MANAATISLCAGATTMTMPDGATVPMWGFALGGATAGSCDATPTIPGPDLNQGVDTELEVTLTNTLSVPVSLIIQGQPLPAGSAPVMNDAPNANRVRSLVHEAAPGGTATYTWSAASATPNALVAGSHVYHSATHQQVQVQMGLYGAMYGDTTAGTAYGIGTDYVSSVNLFYSEIDPVLHNSVANDCFGATVPVPTCTPRLTSTRAYQPRYFLVNGAPSDGSPAIPAGAVSTNILVRMFNAGLKSHMPQSLGIYMSLIAENGFAYRFPKSQHSSAVHALGTADAIINTPTIGDYAIFDRRLNLSDGTTNTGLMSKLTIGNIIDPPPVVATANSITTDEDALSTSINICADDTAVLPETIDNTSALITTTVNGTAFNDGFCNITYLSNLNFNGTDQFTYTVQDTAGSVSNTAVVSITVLPVNDAPVANPDTISVVAGSGVNSFPLSTFLGNDTDVDVGDTKNLLSVTLPANLVAGNVEYDPGTALGGTTDSFLYTMVDSDGLQSSALVTVNIVGAIPPTANPDSALSTAEDIALIIAALDLTSNDTADTSVLPTNIIEPLTVVTTAPVNGTLSAPDLAGNRTYTPNPNFNGTDTFTYTVNDTAGNTSNVATVTITVTPVNDAPVAVDDNTYTASIGSPTLITSPALLDNDTDVDINVPLNCATNQHCVVVPNPNVITTTGGGSVALNVSGSFTYTPPAVGAVVGNTDTFTYQITDGALTSAPATVTLTWTAAAGPVAVDDVATTDEDTVVIIDVLTGDTVNPPRVILPGTVAASTPTTQGGATSTNPDGTVNYTPAQDFFGTDTFTYTVGDDGGFTSNTATVTVTVNPINDAPVDDPDVYTTVGENTQLLVLAPGVLGNCSDVDIPAQTLTTTNLNTTGTAGAVVLGANGDLDYTPATGAVAGDTDTFTYECTDGLLNSATVTVTITIGTAAANKLPSPEKDELSWTGGAGTTMTILVADLISNDADEDGTVVGIRIDTGNAVNNGDGTITYTRPTGNPEKDIFTYFAIDNVGGESTNTAEVEIAF